MITKEEFKKTPMGKAVIELSQEMKKRNMPPVSINVVGGFALMMNKTRNPNDTTDIDYVGSPLPEDFDKLADKIGIKHKLGRGWINNDVMLTGNTMEDFEFATGKLHFNESMDVGNIQINILDEKDVLRMKLIAVDTSLIAAEEGGDFSRIKDLPDVDKLLNKYNIKTNQIMEKYNDYILSEDTPLVIDAYRKGGNKEAIKFVDDMVAKTKIATQQDAWVTAQKTETKSPYLENMFKNLYARYEKEKNKYDDTSPFDIT